MTRNRITTQQITNLMDAVNGSLSDKGSPLRFTAQIYNTPTVVKLMGQGGNHYISQTMTLREAKEALQLTLYTLEYMTPKPE